MGRILVTGATGFIGRSLVPYLLAKGNEVAVLVPEAYAQVDKRPLPPELTAVRPHIQTVYADLRNFRLVVRALRETQPEMVIHLAARGVTDPFFRVETAVRHNVNGTINLIRACFEKTISAQKFISARTSGERSNLNVYAASKAAAWNFAQMYVKTQHWPILGAMIFQAYGPGQPEGTLIPAAIAAAQTGRDFPMTAGGQKRDWIYLPDVVAGLAAMLETALLPGVTVEFGTGKATAVLEVVQTIYGLCGQGGQPQPGILPSRPGEDAWQVANMEANRGLIEWQPAHSLKQGLAKMIAS